MTICFLILRFLFLYKWNVNMTHCIIILKYLEGLFFLFTFWTKKYYLFKKGFNAHK